MVSVVDEPWLQSVILEETAINQQLQAFFPNEQLRLYRTTTPFPVAWLTSQEQAFFETLKHPKRQQSWLLGRTLLKFIALKQSVLLPQAVENPLETLEAWHFPHPCCSVSHTETAGYVIVNLNAKTTQSIGLDVEVVSRKPLSNKALGYLLSNNEWADFEQLSVEKPDCRWDLHYWTGKEALYKATPAGHQGNIQLKSWQLEMPNPTGGYQAQVQTTTGIGLQASVFHTIIPSLQSQCSASIALVQLP